MKQLHKSPPRRGGREARARQGEALIREARARQGEALIREARARQGEALIREARARQGEALIEDPRNASPVGRSVKRSAGVVSSAERFAGLTTPSAPDG